MPSPWWRRARGRLTASARSARGGTGWRRAAGCRAPTSSWRTATAAPPWRSERRPMTALAFLLDFDNTLCDNDRAKADQEAGLRELLGEEHAARFWREYEATRDERGFVDYLLALARFHEALPE